MYLILYLPIIIYCSRKCITGMVKIKVSLFNIDPGSSTPIRNIEVRIHLVQYHIYIMQKYLLSTTTLLVLNVNNKYNHEKYFSMM